jgi:uncharacterized secreted protein with C-terminal beta-propeller domain
VTVLTVDHDLEHLAPVSVDGELLTVYASTDALYLGAASYGATGPTTVVHRLALEGTGAATYTGSGAVPGTLLDQYSLSEQDGALRLVTTTATPFGMQGAETAGGDAPVTTVINESAAAGPSTRLTVLRPDARGALVETGQLDGLGVGEQVRSVRFVGDIAYVVTFRTMDPLFAVDVSDPTAPRLLGELHLPGFSEYLHPVAPGRLLGIGSDAEESNGMVRGFKATLFDVSDPSRPRELDSFVLGGVRSAVADDPHAFTWDARDHLAIVPVAHGIDGCIGMVPCVADDVAVARPANGGSATMAISVIGDHLTVRGMFQHVGDGGAAPIRRAVVVDDALWTVSSVGLGRTEVADPRTVALRPW